MIKGLDINDFKSEDLRIKLLRGESDNDIRINFIGSFQTSYSNNDVDNYLSELHKGIKKYNKKIVRLNFEKLSYLDSRSIGSLIGWFKANKEEDDIHKYSVELRFNKDILAHRASFKMLVGLFPDMVTIKTEIDE